MLEADELRKYDRQIMMEEIGEDGQEKLKSSRVLIAGAGGLGCSVCIYLAVAGVGYIRIVDHDVVDVSNLNRQVLHWQKDIGRSKVDSATEKLKALNPSIVVEGVSETINELSISGMAEEMDLIVDAMDNMETRYILNKYAVDNGTPFFHGAVRGFEGRAMTILPGRTACLMCMHKGPVPDEKFPVLGVAPALIGVIQATEAIKYIVGAGGLLAGRLLIYDGLELSFTEFEVKRNPGCKHCGEGID